jgi:hypothetical protein
MLAILGMMRSVQQWVMHKSADGQAACSCRDPLPIAALTKHAEFQQPLLGFCPCEGAAGLQPFACFSGISLDFESESPMY